MAEKSEPTLTERIETIEQAYEFMLAYAAQGREDEEAGSVREFLQRASALEGSRQPQPQARTLRARRHVRPLLPFSRCSMTTPAKRERRGLVLAQKSISSQLVDNLNASIHLRALLTDVFLIDAALKRSELNGAAELGLIGLGALGSRIATRLR